MPDSRLKVLAKLLLALSFAGCGQAESKTRSKPVAAENGSTAGQVQSPSASQPTPEKRIATH